MKLIFESDIWIYSFYLLKENNFNLVQIYLKFICKC